MFYILRQAFSPSVPTFQQHHIFHMMRMREHVYGLYGGHLVTAIQQLEVSCLRSRITADINDTFRSCEKNHINHIVVHTCPWRIRDDDIRTTMFCNEILSQDILHIAGIKQGIVDTVDCGIDFCILDGFRDIFDTDHLLRLTGDEIGDGSRTGIQVVHRTISVPP